MVMIVRRIVLISLFWGSLWGMVEATLGHFFHFLRIPGLAGSLMFPVGLYFMIQAYLSAHRWPAILLTAQVAAAIKCVDFFLPVQSVFDVINPAMAIICESLALVLLLFAIGFSFSRLRFIHFWTVSVAWRCFLAISIFGLNFIFSIESFFDLGVANVFRFFVLEGLVNGILIYGFFHLRAFSFSDFPRCKHKASAFSSVVVFIAAMVVEFLV